MNTKPYGSNLIFLISQPRAGSTLVQRILGNHPEIYTLSEPWVMLYPLYALRPGGHCAEYDELIARKAVRGFLERLPGGHGEYDEGIRRMCSYLYSQALEGSDKQYFLDKTPRYYLVIPELLRVFPDARYVILLRNPLAVLCSVLRSWVGDNWFLLHEYRHDLMWAPRLLLKGTELAGDRAVVVHYEKLVEDPEAELERVCERLCIGFAPELVDYGRSKPSHWTFGDKEQIHQQTWPIAQMAHKWTRELDDPQVWRLAHDYLERLGQETIEKMGYSHSGLERLLQADQPTQRRLWFTYSLAHLLRTPEDERGRWERELLRLTHSLRTRGLWGTAGIAWRRMVYALSDRF